MDTSKFRDGAHLFRVVDWIGEGVRNAETRSGKYYQSLVLRVCGRIEKHQKLTILQPLLRTITRAVPLCCGAQTELRRAVSKTGVLIIAT